MIQLVEANTSEKEQHGVPYSVMLSLTDTCNEGCPGCFAPSFDEPRMTVEALERVFDELQRCGVKRVSFGGGEPTTRDDLEQVLELAKKKGFLTALSTNGRALGRDPAGLKGLEGRLDEVLVDYHSTRPEVAQAFSPYMDEGHLARAEKLFVEVLKRKIQLKVVTVMFKGTADLTDLQTTGKRLQDIGVRIWKIDQYYHVVDPRRPGYNGDAFSIDDDLYLRNLEHLRTQFPEMKIVGVGAPFKRQQKNFMISAGGTAFINNQHKTQPLGPFLDLMKQGDLLPTYWSNLPVLNYEILEERHMFEKLRSDAAGFLVRVFDFTKELGIDVSKMSIDHIGLRFKKVEDVHLLLKELDKHATLLSTDLVNGRPIYNLQLDLPIPYDSGEIRFVELPCPAENHNYPVDGWDHAEFVLPAEDPEKYDVEFNKKFPSVSPVLREKYGYAFNIYRARGQKLPNPTVVLTKYKGLTVKFHPYTIKQLIDSKSSPMDSNPTNSPKVLAVHHVALQTSDIDAAIRFYVDVLGGLLVERNKFKRREMAWISLAGLRIELFSKREGEKLQPWSDYYSGPVHLALLVPDLDTFVEHAKSKGVGLHPSHPTVFAPPVEVPVRIAYLLGPDGEEVEIRGWKGT